MDTTGAGTSSHTDPHTEHGRSAGRAAPAPMAGTSAATPDAPLLTYCDDATGERMELSAEALGRWAARTTSLLHDGCGLDAGDRVAVLLPAHWQTAAVLLGAWSAGLKVSFRLRATAGLTVHEPDADKPMDAVFVARDRVDDWLENVPEARHRFSLGLSGPGAGAGRQDVPDGYRDFLTEVLRYPDDPHGQAPLLRSSAASIDGTTFRQWGALAQGLAETLDLRAGDRLLVDAAEVEHPVKWLLAPLAVGASVVLCANLDRTNLPARLEAEGITRTL